MIGGMGGRECGAGMDKGGWGGDGRGEGEDVFSDCTTMTCTKKFQPLSDRLNAMIINTVLETLL
jgi:hypothetical protein